MTRFFY